MNCQTFINLMNNNTKVMSKKLYFLFIFSVILSTNIIAQPILTQTNFSYNYPDSVIYFIADSLSVLDTTIGANVIFDYTKLRGYGLKQTGYYVDPASTPSASDFPTANMAENTDATPQNFVYTLSSADSVTNLGFVANVIGFGLTTGKYNVDPEAIMRFPFTYGDSYTDNYAGSFSANSINTDATGSVSITADAWGRLVFSTTLAFDSVLRVTRVENTVTDTIVLFPFPNIAPLTVSATIINYYKPSVSKAPILSFVEGSYSQDGSVVQSNKTVVSQYPMAVVSVEEIKLLNSIELYPNPSINNKTTLSLDIENSKKVKIDLLNSLGQIVFEVTNSNLISGKNKFEINTNKLSSGIYFVAITLENNIKIAKKLIIE